MPTTIKTIKGAKYLYHFHYDGRGTKVEIYCGRADDPEAQRKAVELERKNLGIEGFALEGARGEAELDAHEAVVKELKGKVAFSRNPFLRSFFTLFNADLHGPEPSWKAGAKTVLTLGLYNMKLFREEFAIPKEDRGYYEFLATVYVQSVAREKDEPMEVWRTRIKPSWALAKGFRDERLGFDFESAFKQWEAGAVRLGGASERAWIKKLEVNLLEQFQKDCREVGMPTGRELDSTAFLQLLAWCRIKQRALGSLSYSKIWKEVLLQGLRAIGYA